VQKVVLALIRCSGRLLVGAVVLALLFLVAAGWQQTRAISGQGFRLGLHSTLSLLMLMEPPRSLLHDPPLWLVIFGWFISLVGWLAIPLFIGAIVDVAIGGAESDAQLRLQLYRMLTKADVPSERLDEAVEESFKVVKGLVRRRGHLDDDEHCR